MPTKWRRSKALPKFLDYKNGKGVRTPCRCKKLYNVKLWQKVANTGGIKTDAFIAVDNGTTFSQPSSNGGEQWYTIEPLIENLVINYVMSEACQPGFNNPSGQTMRRDVYPGTAMFGGLTFQVVSISDWKLENIYNENTIVSYWLVEVDGNLTLSAPSIATILGLAPSVWAPFRASYGVGFTDKLFSQQSKFISISPPPTDDSGLTIEESFPTPTTIENNIAPNSPFICENATRCRFRYILFQGTIYERQANYIGRLNYVVCKFTDFKYFNTLTLRVQRFIGSSGRYYAIVTYSQLSTASQFPSQPNKVIIDLPPSGPSQFDIDLTPYLDHSGRNVWVYLPPSNLVDGSFGAIVSSGCQNVVDCGSGCEVSNFTNISGIELIPTFTFGGTP